MGDKQWEAENVFDLFGDELVRQILVLASEQPMAADDLAAHLDSSLPTIYRRVDALTDYDLLDEEVAITDDGNHYTTYETTLKRVTFEVDAGGYDIRVQRRESLVDQFGAFWEDLDRSSPDMGGESPRESTRDPRVEGNDG